MLMALTFKDVAINVMLISESKVLVIVIFLDVVYMDS